MSDAALITRILAARERWIRLDAEREVKIRRPGEIEAADLLQRGTAERYARCVVDWRGPGFTAAGILGAKHGSVDENVPFAIDAWVLLALDNAEWCKTVAVAVRDDVAEHFKRREAAAGN